MANYQNILRQAHQAIADVADNADSWRAFLRSAAYTTHYAFPNQALIYSQRPGATMLADIDTWNRAAGRWVNRGAHGVASLGTGNMAGNVRYLFDIKDTHPAGKDSKPLGWQITDANRYPTLQALQEKHNAESLPEIFGLQAVLFVAQHGKQLDADLQNAVIGSTLEWAKPQEQTAIFANLITQSAVYMAAVRCGLGDSAVPQDAFADIDRFDTESAVLALGNAVNRAGRQMFAEIGAVVKSIDSVAKTQPKQYDENVSKTNQQEVQDHGYDESERVSGTQDGNEGNAQTAGRQNRSAAGEVPAREPLPAVRQDAAGRDAVQRPETDRAALLGAGGADHHEAAGQQPGTGQEQRPVGLDRAHEQSASAGGGTGDAPRDEPVNTESQTAESEPSPSAVSVSDEIELPESLGRGGLAEETAAAIGLPAPEQQQETIRQLQSRASWQPPSKDDGTHIDEQDIVDFRGHYNPVAYLKTDEDAMKLAYALVFNTKKNPAASGGENEFWDKSAVMFLASLILYILYESPLYERNLNTMMDMILECKVSEDSYDENRMDILFAELEQRDPHHPAVLQYRSFKLGSAKTLSSIMVTAVSNLHMLQSAAFAEMIASDEMFLPQLGVEKRAIFCVIPDNDDTFNFMVSILYTQLFDQLFRLADSTPEFHGTLPIHVRLMMDEFANVATPENFVKILAVARSRNISCDIILQNISQIKSKYKDDWETIIGNCDSLVYLGGNDYSTFEYISKLLGKQTIRTKGQSIGKGSHGSSSDSYQVTGRELMTPDEVRRMKRSDCLVMISGEAPVRDKKYNLFDHPNLKYTPDYRSPRGLLHRTATPIPAPEGYTMPPDYMAQAGTVSLAYVAELTCPEITEDLYDELQEWEESLL